MYPFAQPVKVDLASSLTPRTSAEKPDAAALAQADRLAEFLGDISASIAQHRAAHRQAVAEIAADKEQGTVRIPGGALYPVHKQSRDARSESHNALRVLVPAQRMARRLVQQLRFQPGHADLPALEEHLLSHAFRIPRAALFYQDRLLTRTMRHTLLTLTAGQAAIATELLKRYTDLFPWGPKFADAYPV